jgi:hypothetical protein
MVYYRLTCTTVTYRLPAGNIRLVAAAAGGQSLPQVGDVESG